MSSFEVTAPDGTVYDVDGPEGATEEQALQQVMAQHNSQSQKTSTSQAPSFLSNVGRDISKRVQQSQDIKNAYNSGQIGAGEAALQGIGNTGFGTMGDVVGEGVSSLASTLTPDFIKQHVQDKLHQVLSTDIGKSAIQAAQKGGEEWNKFSQENPNAARDVTAIGNALSFMNPASKEISTLATDGAGKAIGAVGDMAEAAGKAALPDVNEGLRDVGNLALKHNIPLSVDELSSSRALKNVQKVSQEIPFAGQEAFREEQNKAFNTALLKTVGVDGDKITKKVLGDAFSKVGAEFDRLGNGKTFNLGDEFKSGIDNILADTTAPTDSVGHFNKEVKRILANTDESGNISGETLNSLRSRINKIARKTNDPDTADLLHDLEMHVIDTMVGKDEAAKTAFSETKRRYKNLIAIEPLVVKGKAGNINPTLLNQRVSKVYGRSHSIGEAGDIGDLAQIGHELLPEPGGSDTLQKAIYAGKAMGSYGTAGAAATIAPLSTAGAIVANRAYQSGINRNQKIIRAMLKGQK